MWRIRDFKFETPIWFPNLIASHGVVMWILWDFLEQKFMINLKKEEYFLHFYSTAFIQVDAKLTNHLTMHW